MSSNINVYEAKKLLVQMLHKIHEYCINNNIRYFLTFGTLLGAVRHKGFIPWDDDIDLAMPRQDYEIFFQNFNKNNSSFYKAIDCQNDKKYYLPYGKVIDIRTILKEEINTKYSIGLYIDIFPMDNVPDDMHENKKFMNQIKLYSYIQSIKFIKYNNKRNILKKFLIIILKALTIIYTSNKLARKCEKLYQKYNNINTQKIAVCAWYKRIEGAIPREYFNHLILMEFEGSSFMCPRDYDKILNAYYGNYMELPPIEERKAHHSYVLKWREDVDSR